MANSNEANPIPLVVKREEGYGSEIRSTFFDKRLEVAKNLYRRELLCHYGCVNAIEFSIDGELFVSGGDDRRVMLWKFGQTIYSRGHPELMNNLHLSNIFCLAISHDKRRIFSGGNDDQMNGKDWLHCGQNLFEDDDDTNLSEDRKRKGEENAEEKPSKRIRIEISGPEESNQIKVECVVNGDNSDIVEAIENVIVKIYKSIGKFK